MGARPIYDTPQSLEKEEGENAVPSHEGDRQITRAGKRCWNEFEAFPSIKLNRTQLDGRHV